jgi:hypothetical protein
MAQKSHGLIDRRHDVLPTRSTKGHTQARFAPGSPVLSRHHLSALIPIGLSYGESKIEGIASSRAKQAVPTVRIHFAPPASPRSCGFSAQISEIVSGYGLIRVLGGTGENHFRAFCARDAATGW